MALGLSWCFVSLVLALTAETLLAMARLPTGRAPRRTRARRKSSLGTWLALDLIGALARVAECDDESKERDEVAECFTVFNGTRISSARSDEILCSLRSLRMTVRPGRRGRSRFRPPLASRLSPL